MLHQLIIFLEMQSVHRGRPCLLLEEASCSLELCSLPKGVLRDRDRAGTLPSADISDSGPCRDTTVYSPAAAVIVGYHEEQGLRGSALNKVCHRSRVICRVNVHWFRTFSISWGCDPRGCSALSSVLCVLNPLILELSPHHAPDLLVLS